ncbi:MAG: radical SAM protein [Thermoguttaceae bacterium]
MHQYVIDGEVLDSLDLKVLLVAEGMHVDDGVCETFASNYRVPTPLRNRRRWGTGLLPDRTVVTLADVAETSPFHLKIGSNGTPCLTHRDRFVTEISFPPATSLFEQKTSRGVPFCDIASMQGLDVLVFAYLWPCEFAKARMACKYCHCGHFTQQEIIEGRFEDFCVDARDVAEVIHFGVNVEKTVRHLQITGGSTFHATEEIDRYVEVLRAIDDIAGRANITGELLVYVTPPADPRDVDKLFAAGVGRVLCDMEFWDEACLREMCPGKAKWTGAKRALDTLLYIARTYGPNRACSEFVVGYEPVESILAGAEHLASHGVVPIPTVWHRHGTPDTGKCVTPGLEYFRKLRKGMAAIYQKYAVEPFGDIGYNVNISRDIWNHREAILQSA